MSYDAGCHVAGPGQASETAVTLPQLPVEEQPLFIFSLVLNAPSLSGCSSENALCRVIITCSVYFREFGVSCYGKLHYLVQRMRCVVSQ